MWREYCNGTTMKKTPLKRNTPLKKSKAMLKIKRNPLDELFSEFIRLRANGYCQRCLQYKGFKNLQTCHFHGRARLSVRYDPDNAIGGCADHIHLIVSIPPKHAVAYVVKNLKGASSHYVNHVLCPENIKFTWQNGYGCLTLGEKQRPKAEEYVLKQKQHHKESTTNSWLEHCEELDDGPIPVESLVESMHQIRETNPKYDLFPDDFPFWYVEIHT